MHHCTTVNEYLVRSLRSLVLCDTFSVGTLIPRPRSTIHCAQGVELLVDKGSIKSSAVRSASAACANYNFRFIPVTGSGAGYPVTLKVTHGITGSIPYPAFGLSVSFAFLLWEHVNTLQHKICLPLTFPLAVIPQNVVLQGARKRSFGWTTVLRLVSDNPTRLLAQGFLL